MHQRLPGWEWGWEGKWDSVQQVCEGAALGARKQPWQSRHLKGFSKVLHMGSLCLPIPNKILQADPHGGPHRTFCSSSKLIKPSRAFLGWGDSALAPPTATWHRASDWMLFSRNRNSQLPRALIRSTQVYWVTISNRNEIWFVCLVFSSHCIFFPLWKLPLPPLGDLYATLSCIVGARDLG